MLLRSAPLLRSQADALSTASLSELGTITCHLSSPVAGSFQALCSTPSLTLSASNIVHMPFVAVDFPVTSSQGGLCPASTRCRTGCVSMSCFCCVCYGRLNHLRSAADWSGPLVHGACLLDTELSLTRFSPLTVLAPSQCAGVSGQGIGVGVAGSGPVYHREDVGLQRFN